MMKYLTIQKQQGSGLIEVLVTMVVTALGLAAVAVFTSDLMQGSGNNKIRSEARALANQKMEEYRNNIEIGTLVDEGVAECTGVNSAIPSGYRSLCPSVGAPEVIVGTNASFTRETTIT